MHLLLHIGPPKTGSSAIQHALRKHRDTLAKHGVLYSSGSGFGTRALSTLFAGPKEVSHPALKRRFGDAEAARAWSRCEWQALEDQVRNSDAKVCVLSSEHFAPLPDIDPFFARLHALFSGISVVAYARDPVRLYASQIQQSVRGGHCLRNLRTPAGYRYPLARALGRYADRIGADNIRVRRFEREHLRGGDVVRDFFGEIGRFAKIPPPEPVNVNESLPGAVIAWLLAVNETWDRSIAPEARERTLKRLETSGRIAALPSFRLRNPEIERLVRASVQQDVAWVNEHFLADEAAIDRGNLAPGAIEKPSEAQQRQLLREDIMSHLTSDALATIADEIMATE